MANLETQTTLIARYRTKTNKELHIKLKGRAAHNLPIIEDKHNTQPTNN